MNPTNFLSTSQSIIEKEKEPRDFPDPKQCLSRNVFALRFYGKNHKVTVQNSSALDKLTNFLTLECWVYLEKECTGYFIVKKSSFALAVKQRLVIISMNNKSPGWVWKNTKHALDLKKWIHLAVTYNANATEACVYVNGILIKRFENMLGTLDCTNNDLYFGLNLVDDHIRGNLSDIRIWKKILTEQQIRDYMTDPPSSEDSDLVGWWPLDKGYGVEIQDRSVNGLRGELSGASWIEVMDSDPYPPTLQEDLKAMFNNPMVSDLKLRTKDSDQILYAHKLILCSRCRVLKAMFLGAMKEGKQEEVVIEDIKYSVLCKLVEFLYTDNITVDGETVMELFQAADKYSLPRLKHLCERFMLDNISLENVCTMLEAADQLQATLLRGECIRWILKYFPQVLESEQILSLPRRLLKEVNQAAAKEHFPPTKRRKLNKEDSNYPECGN
eukprot:TRINITY_DN10580_c0_g1_i1.p1 TRINITY_DN10580_c0_g1~~TRINITY_DN10580_c0_g1_i1.p1  ORF type:complete len:442 (+),score=65.32 TRINITY_DN10580_c0_g1_i1:90-1415(+)